MAVSAKHPKFDDYKADWDQMKDTYAGERTVKSEGTKYLPPTSGMRADGMNEGQDGKKAYDSYRTRAVYHDFVKDAITTMVDLMHRKPPVIKVPKRMEPMLKKLTAQGHSAETLLRKINFNQLRTSRMGLLVDVASGQGPNALPYIATYADEAIINWDAGAREDGQVDLRFVVLNETESKRNGFEWTEEEKYRVLTSPTSDLIPEGTSSPSTPNSSSDGFWAFRVRGANGDLEGAESVRPQIGGKSLKHIPFTFVNAGDLDADPEAPVLIGLSNISLAIYRGEADYRQTLFAQGQDTLVVIGAIVEDDDEDGGNGTRVGAGAKIEVPLGGDAKYIGVSADGLMEQREALKADKEQAAERGARLLDFGDTARQSGDALRIRVAARTTTLRTIAITGGAALERSLKQAAEWIGEDPDEVSVKPNLDFTDDSFTGQDVLELMQAKAMGAPLSLRTLHDLFRRRDMTEKSFEIEQAEIEGEKSLTMGTVLDPAQDKDDAGQVVDPRQTTDNNTPGPNTTTDN